MLPQILLILSASTVCLALGNGRTKNAFQKQAPQQFSSVASYHSSKPFPDAPQPARLEQEALAAPAPYSFGYDAEGSARQESGDASGKVTGSYKVVNEDGSVRIVNYIADEQGFRADVQTDEPGTKNEYGPPAASKYGQSQELISAFKSQKQETHKWSTPTRTQERLQQSSQLKPSPYAFSYDSQMDDGSSFRTETGDESGKVVGSYSLSGSDGRRRTVNYQADADGFRASVDTNEMGTKQDSPADVQFHSSAPQAPVAERLSSFSGSQVKSSYKAPAFSGIKSFQSASQQSGVKYSGDQSAPSPYSFSYDAQLEDGSSSRTEYGDGNGKVTGSYSLTGADGRKRVVEYLADEGGFRANVNTNEFGTKSDSPADVQFYSSATLDEPAPYYASKASSRQHAQIRTGQQVMPFPMEFSMGDDGAYSYSYQTQLEDGGSLGQKESRDGSGYVSGQYSMSGLDGQRRTVDYSAGEAGFQASVDTNEFGTKSDSPAHVKFLSSAPQEASPEPAAYKSTKTAARQVSRPAPLAFKVPAPQMAARQNAGSSGMYSSSFSRQQQVESAPPSPYAFQYEAEATGGMSARQESGDGSGAVTGSYTVRNEDGSLRVVKYVADHEGFRANVETNEPGTLGGIESLKSQAPLRSHAQPQAPLRSHAQPQAPLRNHAQPQAPLRSHAQSQAPLRSHAQSQAPVRAEKQRSRFPVRQHSQKSSEISQKAIEWSR